MRELSYIIFFMTTFSGSQLFQIDNKLPNGSCLFSFWEVSLAVFISLIVVVLLMTSAEGYTFSEVLQRKMLLLCLPWSVKPKL